jgi:hypothetical protein
MSGLSRRERFAKLTRLTSLAACALALAALLLGADAAMPAEPTRVLLVGNSYTQFHMLPRLIERLAASTDTALQVDAVTHSGYTLRRHWIVGLARERIASGGYQLVVLQDHSLRPIDRPAEFDDYGQRFARAVESAGASTVLFQTWAPGPRARFYRERAKTADAVIDATTVTARLEHAYADLAQRESARVAPVGRAFARAAETHPELELYGADGTHPSWSGSYLAACVLYGTLTGRDPREATYAPWELNRGEAPLLRELAASAASVR